jgi:4-hydroxyphenylpyruvate dioxygenase
MQGGRRELVGFDNFVRHNPMSDKFNVEKFHHLEFYTSDATNTARRFIWGLGMKQVGKSDLTTGNKDYTSFVLQSNDIVFVMTAPFSTKCDNSGSDIPCPNFDRVLAQNFISDHGLAVKAVGIKVADSISAFHTSCANGAIPVLEPTELPDKKSGQICIIAEVKLFGDVVLRFISGDFSGPFLPKYEETPSPEIGYGLRYIDHCVHNVPNLFEAVDYLSGFSGFHEFSEFTAADVGTVDSGLNSMVLASNNERVLLPVNEPTFGTKRKSQIQTYLEMNCGPGLQHIALKTDDIIATMKEMRSRSYIGGFEFMPRPEEGYYDRIPKRIGEGTLSNELLEQVKELGLLVDKDDQGILIQVFTKPLGDRPTIFIEIIQRIGCDVDPITKAKMEQAPGCGGFGKGNFSELFKSIEDFERSFDK